MCGILVCSNSYGKDFINNAIDIISKRGADSVKSISYDDFTFVHSRLIITGDADNGSQPIESDKGIFLFNGEIYNFKYLNGLLSKPLNGNYSDSQVIHSCILEFGFEIIDSFDGPFSIVYYDKKEKSIHAFRDHVGEKPLFHFDSSKGSIFSSDLKIYKYLSETSVISGDSLFEYLSMGYVPHQNTIFEKVHKVYPWNTRKNKYYYDYLNYVDANFGQDLTSRLSCVAQQISYKEAALLLSGGVDSTLVACILSGEYIHLYTTKTNNDENKECELAILTSKKLGLPLTVIEFNSNLDLKFITDVVNSLNEPVGDPGIINQYISIKKLNMDQRKVVFVGTGGDEIFLGYPRYRFSLVKKIIDMMPKYIVHKLMHIAMRLKFSDLNINRIIKLLSLDARLFTPEYDVKNYLPNQLFSAFDSISFNNGIEARTPFTSILLLDHAVTSNNARLIDYAILKFKLKFILLKKFGINKFFTVKRGFTNEYTNYGITIKDVNMNLFHNSEEIYDQIKKSELHLFRAFVLCNWLEC